MNIMIVGGTGFLGYYTALAALERGHKVSSYSLDDINLEGWYPEEIDTKFGDVFEQTEDELVEVFKGYDAMVYSVGPDDRITPPAPSYDFFYDKLVEQAGKVFRAARRAGVKRSVVYNSYFAYFDRVYPEKRLAELHPYIGARVAQAEKLISESNGEMDVMVLELPYIFGSMPERMPLWKDVFLERFCKGKMIFFPGGGTTMITVKHVGEAGVGALEYGEHGERYPIGDENHSYNFMLDTFMRAGGTPKKIINVNKRLCAMGANMLAKHEAKKGLEPGLNYKHLMLDIMDDNFYIDADEVAAKLRYGRGGVKEAIEETMHKCYPDGFK